MRTNVQSSIFFFIKHFFSVLLQDIIIPLPTLKRMSIFEQILILYCVNGRLYIFVVFTRVYNMIVTYELSPIYHVHYTATLFMRYMPVVRT